MPAARGDRRARGPGVRGGYGYARMASGEGLQPASGSREHSTADAPVRGRGGRGGGGEGVRARDRRTGQRAQIAMNIIAWPVLRIASVSIPARASGGWLSEF